MTLMQARASGSLALASMGMVTLEIADFRMPLRSTWAAVLAHEGTSGPPPSQVHLLQGTRLPGRGA